MSIQIQLNLKKYPVVTTFLITFMAIILVIIGIWRIFIIPNEKEIAILKAEIEELKAKLSQIDDQPNISIVEKSPNEFLQELIVEKNAHFEWQWAGENWYGRVIFDRDNQLELARVFTIEKEDVNGKIIFPVGDRILELDKGTYTIVGNNQLRLDLDVQTGDSSQTISGFLEQRLCYAGTVTYHDPNSDERSRGDMVLVNYLSLTDEQIENQFIP